MDFAKALAKLKSTLPEDQQTAIADQLDALGQALQPYAGLDPQIAKAAIEAQASRGAIDSQLQTTAAERDNWKAQAEQLQTVATTALKETQAVRGLTAAGVRPEYESLLLPTVLTGLEVKEDGKVTAPDGFMDGLKGKFPAMFFADDAAGGGTPGGSDTTPAPTSVSAVNGVVSGVNPADVLAGKVILSA